MIKEILNGQLFQMVTRSSILVWIYFIREEEQKYKKTGMLEYGPIELQFNCLS